MPSLCNFSALSRSLLLAGAATATLVGGCAAPRLTAATQPTPAKFEVAASDPKAVATVDAAVTALGGARNWDTLKELRFTVKNSFKGELKGWFKHQWDRWNGRHHFEVADLTTMAANPNETKWTRVSYDMFDKDARPFGRYHKTPLSVDDARKASQQARERFTDDGYLVMLPYKLHDPGVKLSDGGEVKDLKGACLPSCQTVKVTFDPGVGTKTWYVNFNTVTHLPEVIEQEHGADGRIGYHIDGWTTAGGLQWPTQLTNVGEHGEVFTFSDFVVDEPEDATYMPSVAG